MTDPRNGYYYADEIDLMEIFAILWRRKWLIALITGVIVLIAGAVTVSLPKIYRTYVVIEPSIINTTADGRYIYLDTVQNIKGKIQSNAYHQRLVKALQFDPDSAEINFQIDIPNNSNVIKVSYDVEKDQVQQGITTLHQLITEMQDDYALEIQRKKNELENQVLMKQNSIQALEIKRKDMAKQIAIKEKTMQEKQAQVGIKKDALAILEQREKDLLQELKEVKANTEKIIQQRDAFLNESSKGSAGGVSDLLYSTTIQQNVAFFNELQNQISELKMQKEETRADMKTLEKDISEITLQIERMVIEKNEQIQSQIDAIAIEIADLENRIANIQNLQMISEPTSTAHPVKPRVLLNIVLSGLVGLILGIFIAFIAHWRETAHAESPPPPSD